MKRKKLRAIHARRRRCIDTDGSVTTGDVWDVICDSVEEANEMRKKTSLMIWIADAISARGLGSAAAAALFGIPEERFLQLQRGRFFQFSIEEIERMATTIEETASGSESTE
ncbi:MAG TPA: XRE family transcriptional regulator [Noviherbaspirillum sp.]|nr:XRE family transcriptional regulator [Noviherbaspirillum sp.]